MIQFEGKSYQEIDIHPRYAKNGDSVYSYILDDEDNEIPKIFTVKHVSVSYVSLETKELKKIEKKIDSLFKNYKEENLNSIRELMQRSEKIKPETGYIRSDELDSKYDMEDLEDCHTIIVTEEEYDKYGEGTYFKPYLLEISTCKLVKQLN